MRKHNETKTGRGEEGGEIKPDIFIYSPFAKQFEMLGFHFDTV